jgi:hypothetical protein
MTITILEEGTCECIREPNCRGGMEGYNIKSVYRFQHCVNTAGRNPKAKYYRVWHSETYYETCAPQMFTTHFKINPTPTMKPKRGHKNN